MKISPATSDLPLWRSPFRVKRGQGIDYCRLIAEGTQAVMITVGRLVLLECHEPDS
jgi:hypothetical protein